VRLIPQDLRALNLKLFTLSPVFRLFTGPSTLNENEKKNDERRTIERRMTNKKTGVMEPSQFGWRIEKLE
jgi:hypothetical protein